MNEAELIEIEKMNKTELIEILESGEFDYEFSKYNAMCEKAKSFVFSYLLSQISNSRYADTIAAYDTFDSKLTPIEQIFYAAYRLYLIDFFKCDDLIKSVVPLSVILNEEITPQQEVFCNGKKYIIDFLIDFSRKSVINGEYIYPELKDLKYAVELDGYDYHSNKKQMEHDYERENDLRKFGYTVVRFTGSQIYKKPLSCIDTLINIIVNDIKRKEGKQ